jgi:integration host factor subunit beta
VLKSQLVKKLTQANPHLFERNAEKIVRVILDEMTMALAHHGRVELRGFGSFGVKLREAHIGRNPHNGAQIPVAEKYQPFFRMARELLERLNREGSGASSLISRER